MENIEDVFHHYIDRAIEQMPSEFREKMDNVNIFVEPGFNNPNLLGLYQGIPQNRRGNYGIGGPMPDKITIFIYPILSRVKSNAELEKQIKHTLYHEIGHHFGMSEEQIRKATIEK